MDKYAEALGIEYLVKELVETYSRALHQDQALAKPRILNLKAFFWRK